MEAQGKSGPGKVIFTVVRRRNIPDVVAKVSAYSPKAFYSVEDVRYAAEGTFPQVRNRRAELRLFKYFRKGK
jgi:hypothetical protein